MNVPSHEINKYVEMAGLSPLELAKLRAVTAVYARMLIMFYEYSLEKYLMTKECRTIEDCSSAIEEFSNSREIKDRIFTEVQSRLFNFIELEKVCGNVGQATSIQEVQAFMKKFEANEHRLRRRVKVWLDRSLYRTK